MRPAGGDHHRGDAVDDDLGPSSSSSSSRTVVGTCVGRVSREQRAHGVRVVTLEDDDRRPARRGRRRRKRRWTTVHACSLAVSAILAARGVDAAFGWGGRGASASTPNEVETSARRNANGLAALGGDAYEFVDEEAGLRFGSVPEDVLRRILEDTTDDDPDDVDEARELVYEDEEEQEEQEVDTSERETRTRAFAALGSAAPPRRAKLGAGEATEAHALDPDEALRRVREALDLEDDWSSASEESSSASEASLGATPSSSSRAPSVVGGVAAPARVRDASVATRRITPKVPKPLADVVRKRSASILPAGGFPLFVPGASKASDVNAKSTDRPGWELTFSDEFNGDSLDLTKWTPKSNASAPGLERNGGQQQFYSADMCKVVDGALVIATRRQQGVDKPATPHGGGVRRGSGEQYPFLSCWVDSKDKFDQTYGRVEIRAKLPKPTCPGIWPQHWMLPHPDKSVPKQACWPLGGQIDIMQSYGRGLGGPGTRPGTVETGYHFAPKGECGAEGYSRSAYPPVLERQIDFSVAFHTYAVEWSKESLTFFVDGRPVHQLSRFNVPIIPRWPFYLILNTAVSPFGMPAALGEDCAEDMFHFVDYVRVYKRASAVVTQDVYRFLIFSVVTLCAFVVLSFFALRGAYNREESIEDYEYEDDEDAFEGEELYMTTRDEHGHSLDKPIKRYEYSLDGDEGGAMGLRRRLKATPAESPLIGDIALALPDDGTGRYRLTGPHIRRRANPPSSGNTGYYADVWARDEEYRR